MTTSTARRPLSTEAVIKRMSTSLIKTGKSEFAGYSIGRDAAVSTPYLFISRYSMLILDDAHGWYSSDRDLSELGDIPSRVPYKPVEYRPFSGTGSRRVYISVNLLSDIIRTNGGRKLDNIVPVYVANNVYCNAAYLLDIIDALHITDDIIPVYVYKRESTSTPLICVYGHNGERGGLLPIRFKRDCVPSYTPALDITLIPELPSKRAPIAAIIDSYRKYSITTDSYASERSYCTFNVPTAYCNATENMPREMSLSIFDAVNMFAKINDLVSHAPELAFYVRATVHCFSNGINSVPFEFVLDGGESINPLDHIQFTAIPFGPDFYRARFWGAYNSERRALIAARKAAAAKYVKSTAITPAIIAPAYKPAAEIVKPAPVATQTPVVRPVHAAPVKPVYVHIVPAIVPAIRVPATAGRYTFDRAAADSIAAARPGTSTAAPTVNQGAGYTPDYMPPRISPTFDVCAAYMVGGIDIPPRALTPLTAAYSPAHVAGAAGGYMARVDTAAAYTPPAGGTPCILSAGDYSPDISETAGGSYSPMYTAPLARGGRYTPPITEPPGSAQGALGGRGARSITPAAGVPPIMSPLPIMGGTGRIAPIIAAPPYNGKRPYNSRHTYTAGGSMCAGVPPDSDGAPLQRAPKIPIMRFRRKKRIMLYNAI